MSDFLSGPKVYCGSEGPGPVSPAGVAEPPLGFCVSRRRIRQLWSSCCSPPRGCSSVLGCSSSTGPPWRPASAPSPWWVSEELCRMHPVPPTGSISPVTTTLSPARKSLRVACPSFVFVQAIRWERVLGPLCAQQGPGQRSPCPCWSACLFPAPYQRCPLLQPRVEPSCCRWIWTPT